MTIRVSSPVDRSNKQMPHLRSKVWLLILNVSVTVMIACLSEWLSSLGSDSMQNINWLDQCENYHLVRSVWKNITSLCQYEKHHLARSLWKTPPVSVSTKNITWLCQYEKHHLTLSVWKTSPGSVSMKNIIWLGQYEKHHLSVSMKNIT
jgi:hypothetical protein